MFQIVETHSRELSLSLAKKLRTSERTKGYRNIPEVDLAELGLQVYENLSEWLLTKTSSDIELRYKELGNRRAQQGIPLSQLIWALLLSKEELWALLQRERFADRILELYGEREFARMLDNFFDQALYFATRGYEESVQKKAHVA
ncbi:MAG TPA: hypothetical protein VKW78_15490 [Terriglobales bacterium]|nr:hypothetical protein [Terriglobales bacterium]